MVKIARAEHLPTWPSSPATITGRMIFGSRKQLGSYSVNLVMTMPLFKASPCRPGCPIQGRAQEIEFGEKALLDAVRFELNQAVINWNRPGNAFVDREKRGQALRPSASRAELCRGAGDESGREHGPGALSRSRTNYSQALPVSFPWLSLKKPPERTGAAASRSKEIAMKRSVPSCIWLCC